MENKNPISEELKEISPLVATISHQLPYTAPAGYFDAFSMQLMLRIAMEEKAGIDPVLNIPKKDTYQVPEGYFDGLADSVLQRINESPESVPSVLASADKTMPFTVPAGYFDALAGSIMNSIKAQQTDNAREELEILSPLLGSIGKKTPFTSPEGYFTDIPENIVAGVKAIDFVNEELENLSAVMLHLKNKQVYEVPPGYFDTVAPAVMASIKKQPAAKVVFIGFGKKMMRYAAAAVVTGIVVVAGYLTINKNGAVNNPVVAANTSWDSATVAKIPDQEIESFLNTNTISLADVSDDNPDDENDLKALLADISDEELRQYLEQHGATPNSITN